MKKRRFLNWLSRFLEAYAKEKYIETIDKLDKLVLEKDVLIREQQAYIAGLERGTRARSITINNGVN